MLWPEWRPGPGPWSWLVSLAVWACPTPSLPSPGCRPTRLFFTRTWTCIPRRDCCQHIGLGWIILRRLKDSALFMDLFWHWALIPGGRDYHLSPSQFLLGQIHVGELKPEVRISFRRVHRNSMEAAHVLHHARVSMCHVLCDVYGAGHTGLEPPVGLRSIHI